MPTVEKPASKKATASQQKRPVVKVNPALDRDEHTMSVAEKRKYDRALELLKAVKIVS